LEHEVLHLSSNSLDLAHSKHFKRHVLKIFSLALFLQVSMALEARTLILGDSHSFGAFGKHLSNELEQNGRNPWLIAVLW